MIETPLLLEGGLAGHMSHLHEDPQLTFQKIKDVLIKASEGQLEGTEKTDGQNLFISYSVKDGKAKAARNKGNIKTGGLTAKGLAEKFGGRGSLEVAFTEAFDAFEKAVSVFETEELQEIFGPDAEIFYNAEIQDPRNANIINYDFKTLNIHRVGHASFNRETGLIEDIDVSRNAEKLENALEKLKDHFENDKFRVQMNAIRQLEKLDNKDVLISALGRLEGEINSYGLSDSQTIGDYLAIKITPRILEDFPMIPEEKLPLIMDRLFLGTKIKVKDIQVDLNKEQKKEVSLAVKKLGGYFKEAIAPIEDLVHDFAVEILKAFRSRFILDNDKEVARLQKEVGQAIDAIKTSGREDAIQVLTKHLKKLKKAENISSAAEGFVFDYDGKTYKFTGNFAPANQLLGLFKYGRGNIPPLQRKLDENVLGEKRKLVVLLPGGFKPPHKGHYNMIKFYNDHEDVERVIVLIGPKERKFERKEGEEGESLVVDREQSIEIFKLYGVEEMSKVKVEETKYNSPIQAAYEFLISDPRREEYKELAFSMGASGKDSDFKRAEDFKNYFANKKPDKLPEGFHVGIPPRAEVEGGDSPLSATKFREAVANKDTEVIKQLVPDNVQADDLLAIFYKKEDNGKLEEYSSMAGGNISGASGVKAAPGKKKRKKRKPESTNEQQIRLLVRKGIGIIMEQKTIEEQRLRTAIRKIISKKYSSKILSEQEDQTAGMGDGTRSTAITYLEKLLKTIIPSKNSSGGNFEAEYLSLDRPEYRQSFLKHVIQGIYDELAPRTSLGVFLAKFGQRKDQFLQKYKEQEAQLEQASLAESLFITEETDTKFTFELDTDGIPNTGMEKDVEDQQSQLEAEQAAQEQSDEKNTTGDVLDVGPDDDFPEESQLEGESTIGRKAAYRFVGASVPRIIKYIDSLEETEFEEKQREQDDPDSTAPQEEFVDFLFTNLMLHGWRLENKHFHSTYSEIEDFFSDVTSKASTERVKAGDKMSPEEEELDLEVEDDEDEALDFDLDL